MGEKARYKRRKIPLVDRGAQLYMALIVLLYMVIYTIIILLAILLPPTMEFTLEELPMQDQLQASRIFLYFDKLVVPVVLAIMALLALHFLFLTYRIFGPLTRFKRVLLSWSEGIWPGSFKGRRGDFHSDLFQVFSFTAEKIGRDFRDTRDQVTSSLRVLNSLADGDAAAGTAAGLPEAVENCRRALSTLEKYFPVPEDESGED